MALQPFEQQHFGTAGIEGVNIHSNEPNETKAWFRHVYTIWSGDKLDLCYSSRGLHRAFSHGKWQMGTLVPTLISIEYLGSYMEIQASLKHVTNNVKNHIPIFLAWNSKC